MNVIDPQQQGVTPQHSAVEQNIYKVFPNDLNSNYTVFGGVVMSLCDRTALVIAERHSRSMCVTVSVDNLSFKAPAKQGDTLIVKGSINRSWNSSMEIGVKVLAENSHSGEVKHIVSAYMTFVALDDAGKPVPVPSVTPETEEQCRRYQEADIRRKARLTTLEAIAKRSHPA